MSDLIKREDAIDTVEELNRKVNDGRENDTVCTSDVLRRIKALPSAEAVSREAIISAKFHPYPFTQITPTDVEAESYKRGWNDALDAVVEDARESEVEE